MDAFILHENIAQLFLFRGKSLNMLYYGAEVSHCRTLVNDRLVPRGRNFFKGFFEKGGHQAQLVPTWFWPL